MGKRKFLLILLGILMIGCFLRFYGLDRESLENDELASWVESRKGYFHSVIRNRSPEEVTPPLYYLILFAVIHSFGDSEVILRLPSAISGLISILIIFLLGRTLYSNEEGLVASSLISFLWCPIFYSQSARVYSLLLLFTLLSTLFWIQILRAFQKGGNPSPLLILFYFLTATVSTYLHHFGLFWIYLQGFYSVVVFLKNPRLFLKILLLYLIIGITYLPMLSIFLEDSEKVLQWIPTPGIRHIGGYARFLFNSIWLLFPVAGLFLLFAFRSLKNWRFKIEPLSSGTILLFWLVVPYLGAFLLSHLTTPVYSHRNLIISLPPAYLLLSRSITQFPVKKTFRTALWVVLLFLFLMDLLFIKEYFSTPQKAQFREAVEYVVQEESLYENSMVIGCVWNEEYLNYYFERENSHRRVDLIGGSGEEIAKIHGGILSKDPSYIWLIQAHRRMEKDFHDYFQNNFETIDSKPFHWAEVTLYKRKDG